MSEKATLLNAIPPVKKAGSDSGHKKSLLSTKSEGKVSLLSQTKDAPPAPSARETASEKPKAAKPGSKQPAKTESGTVETAASEAVAGEPQSITPFHYVTYASFVLNFLLAGIVAVILFRKAAKLAEERFVVSAKAFGIAGIIIALHGFFATYLYNSHLNETGTSAPLFLTMAVWILVGPAVGFITRSLLTRREKPNRKAAMIDAVIYGFIFSLAALGVSSGIKTNAALLSTIFAGFLMIVPIARSMSAFKVAKARHKDLNETSEKILIYGLLVIPALLPVLAFAHICGLGDAATLFLINFITFDFLLVVALSMIASADELVPEAVEEAAKEVADPPEAPEAAEADAESAAPETLAPEEPVPEPEMEPVAQPRKPERVASGNPDDPIIQFLNSQSDEDDEDEKPAAPAKPAAKSPPPRKPGKPGIRPPKKPGSSSEGKSAPNAPSRLKAPAKPKKRF